MYVHLLTADVFHFFRVPISRCVRFITASRAGAKKKGFDPISVSPYRHNKLSPHKMPMTHPTGTPNDSTMNGAHARSGSGSIGSPGAESWELGAVVLTVEQKGCKNTDRSSANNIFA